MVGSCVGSCTIRRSALADERGTVGPRIALALSGGGARGFAHIGVLKVLEELRVPIACIAGTSMGSVVGGGYAVGRSPADLARIAADADWDEIFNDAPPRGETSPRRKTDDYKNFFAPEFGFRDGGLALPKGVLAGLSIESFLRYVALGAQGAGDFDRLPIPFRAVAADIATGDAIVLRAGNVSEAMRASMSIPGAVAPVEIEGRLLVDGGIANNLPIEVARQLCGDVVIAVNVGTPPMKRADITSAASVVGPLINFLGKATTDRQIAGFATNRRADLA